MFLYFLSVCLFVCSAERRTSASLRQCLSLSVCLSVFVCVSVCVLSHVSVWLFICVCYVSVFTISRQSGLKQGLIMSCTISFYRKVKVKATQGQVHSQKLSTSNKHVRDLFSSRTYFCKKILTNCIFFNWFRVHAHGPVSQPGSVTRCRFDMKLSRCCLWSTAIRYWNKTNYRSGTVNS